VHVQECVVASHTYKIVPDIIMTLHDVLLQLTFFLFFLIILMLKRTQIPDGGSQFVARVVCP
jgi:hypothetical protein